MFLHHDEDLLEGFPYKLECSGEGSPTLFDIDRDGKDEIILTTSDGYLHVFNDDLTELDGFPVHTDVLKEFDPNYSGNHLNAPAYRNQAVPFPYGSFVNTAAVGDLDGDGVYEIVAGALDGKLYVWESNGERREGFPVEMDPSFSEHTDRYNIYDYAFFGSPALGDIDGDGDLEIIIAGCDQHVYVWHHNGEYAEGFPVKAIDTSQPQPQGDRIVASPGLADLDGDSLPEIVISTNEIYENTGRIYAFDQDGSLLPGWPVSPSGFELEVLPYIGKGVPGSPVLADINNDSVEEIIACAISGNYIAYDYLGEELLIFELSNFGAFSNSNDTFSIPDIFNPVVADLNNDSVLELISAGVGDSGLRAAYYKGLMIPVEHQINAWNTQTGQFLDYFPRVVEDFQFLHNYAVADLNGDFLPEIIGGSGGYILHAINYYGEEPIGWPKFTGGWIVPTPAVGDIDGDNLLEVVVLTREGFLFAWNTNSPLYKDQNNVNIEWAQFRHDPYLTGNYNTSLNQFHKKINSSIKVNKIIKNVRVNEN